MLRVLLIIAGSIFIASAYNLFYIPHHILSSGVSGIAILLGIITPINTGILIFLLNLPLLVLGIIKLGKRFITYTILSVIVVSASSYLIPVFPLSSEPFLSCLFGGVLTGIGAALIFNASGSSGGFDIVAMLLLKKRDFPLGALLSGMNAVVVFLSGFIFNWDSALYTMVAIFTSGRVVDTIHTTQIKLTLMIITSEGAEMKKIFLDRLHRGVTMMEGEGAFTGEKRKILMTVITRYELSEVKALIRKTDPHAFVNITKTTEVIGSFHRV
ncbi:YitT family protein [Bacillaceae bacterium Marseille-Q3522]|nr:YitT family protein [Bacillaceae bacterium Marseille-Q3522]